MFTLLDTRRTLHQAAVRALRFLRSRPFRLRAAFDNHLPLRAEGEPREQLPAGRLRAFEGERTSLILAHSHHLLPVQQSFIPMRQTEKPKSILAPA